MTHPVVSEPPESHSTLLGDRRAEPLAALLDLPWTDPEVRDLTAMLLAALDAAQQTGRSELLRDALCFAEGRLQVRRLSRAGCAGIGAALETVVTAHLATGDLARVRAVVSEALAGVPAVLAAETDSLGPVATAYVDDLVRGDRASAVARVRRCVAEGMDVLEILLDVLEPAQHEVGRRWAVGRISVAQEHFCTAVTEFVMTDLYGLLFTAEESRRRLVALHAPGSLHHVGLRMVVDVLECLDWSTTYLVEEVPVDSLPGLVVDEQADLVLISATMPGQVAAVKAMIEALHHDPRTRDVKVVVGGRPFNLAPGLAAEVGADGWAADARATVEVCDRLVGAQ